MERLERDRVYAVTKDFVKEASDLVQTIPSRLDFTQVPDGNVDLSVRSARLQCTTSGCTYPPPLIQWLTQGQTSSSPYEVYKTVNPSGTGGSCVPPEQLYTGTLDLQQNITWSDNSDKVLTFSCRIEYPDSRMNLTTSGSQPIKFAVRVTEAFLQQNNQNITSTLTVNSGVPVTLTCLTGTSRPAPTIGWYIGSRPIGSGTSLTFTPSNTDHNEVIFCQVYNIDPNLKVNSSKSSLFVRVRVTEAYLQIKNQNITSTLTVHSGEPVTLTCITGTSRPDPIIDWYIGSRSIGSGTSLTFTPSNTDHNEVIFCQAYNIDPNLKVDSNKPRLFVRAAPKILDVSPSYKGYVGQYTMIQFNVNSITKENLTVTARHSNTSGLIHQGIIQPILPYSIPVNSSQIPMPDFRGIISIGIMSENDFGPYVIEVKNIVGSDSENIQIIRQITPEKPSSFHATNVQEKQLSLRWQAGYNGGYTQTFIVQISHDNITWNNASQVSAGNRDGWFTTVIEDLIPGSDYYFRLCAYNINGRGDLADVQLAIRTLKDVCASDGISVGGAVGAGVGGAVGGIVLGLIGAIIAFTFRRQLNGSKCSCLRSKMRTDDELHSYSNTEMNPQTVKPIYEELNKGNTEQRVYDKISPLEG
ncbi:hypothetical protein ACJMK2_027423 [Sinanodonta woodiana]|uniref:Uncharacterized protein n=1 Tax=Sinanodonta woodiana TaxID=1069815 RepID=A0ABD3XR03_SINWO